MPDLLEVEEIASNTPIRTVTLSGISVTVLFTALNGAGRLNDWRVDGWQLNPSEIDRLQAYLALAYKELMVSNLGEIKATAAATLPFGCLWCDGGIYEKDDYPDLYAVLSSAFVIDSTHFQTPDLREKFIFGADGILSIGTTGGEASHTLTVDEIPSHAHSIPQTATTLAVEPGEVAVVTPIPILTSSTGDTGSSESHNNIPPFVALGYYIVAR